MAYIRNSVDFSEVNASDNTLITTALPQGAVNYYVREIVANTWYRYYDTVVGEIYESAGDLYIISDASSTHNGIMQQLSNLIVGQSYDIEINTEVFANETRLLIYTGTILQSTHILTGADSQIIQFTANSKADIIVLDTQYVAVSNSLQISSINITTTPETIPFITGVEVKPLSTSELGVVTFTDGTNDVTPNQLQCESYGYTFNKVSGTCSAFRYNTNLNRSFDNINNKAFGAGNSTQTGTNNTLVMGENNTVRGFSRNSIITGDKNEIANGVNNANVSGTLGEVTADNSIVLGGNNGSDSLGERQTMTLMYGALTTDNSTVDAFLNNTTDSYFVVPENTAVYFQSETLAVRVGGSGAGNVGDFKAWVERGVVINKSGVLSIVRSRTSPAASGTTTGWNPINSVSGTNFLQTVKGANNRDIMWASTIRLTQIKTGVTL